MESTIKEIIAAADDLHMMRKGEKPMVKMYEGKEGLYSMLQDIVKTAPTVIDEITNEDVVASVFTDEDELGTKTRLLSISKDPGPTRKKTSRRLIARNDLRFNGDIAVYDSKIALYTWRGKMMSVLIESKDLADTVRALFQMAWDSENK